MVSLRRADGAGLELDVALLAGFRFGCRPDCGLCCFTSPRLEGDDERRLRAVAPESRIVRSDRVDRIAARPDGGACQFLVGLHCSVHVARPAPCREFPISVHVGQRLQATGVLSCPGLALDPVERFGDRTPDEEPEGLGTELASVHSRITPATERRRLEAERRRRRIARILEEDGRWVSEEEVRSDLRGTGLIPDEAEFSPQQPPEPDDGLEYLPLYFDGRSGPVALGRSLGGWEARELAAEGGSRPVGVAVPPDRRPELDPSAERLLAGYLRYWLARDCFLAAVHLEMPTRPERSVTEAALRDLHAIASDVMARGAFRSKLLGEDGVRLTREAIALGIRSTDQDWLDRPTWGSRL